MQTDITEISIPIPCYESWDNMSASKGGRFCGTCCKTVTDFTRTSEQQIIDILSRSQNTCCRIEPWQISSVNRQLAQPLQQRSYWRALVATITLMLAVGSAHAQTKSKAKNIHKTEAVKKMQRPARDSMTIYPLASITTIIAAAPEVKLQPTEFVALYSARVGGLAVMIEPKEAKKVPTGYFKSIEEMLQGMF